MGESAFMTDETWLKIVPHLSRAIREMPVICDHCDWWVVLTLDGFGSHVNVPEEVEIFTSNKILVVKEEGYSSHVNQPYDANVALEDKQKYRQLSMMSNKILQQSMDQRYFMAIAIEAQRAVSEETWLSSFMKINLYPKLHVSADEWPKTLDRRVFLKSEKFFKNRETMYYAMPAC